MAEKKLDLSKFVCVKSKSTLLLLNPNEMITITYIDENSDFKSVMISPANIFATISDIENIKFFNKKQTKSHS